MIKLKDFVKITDESVRLLVRDGEGVIAACRSREVEKYIRRYHKIDDLLVTWIDSSAYDDTIYLEVEEV